MNGFDDLIKAGLIFVVAIPIIWLIAIQTSNLITEFQLQPYKQQLQQKDAEIQSLKQQIAQLEQQLEEWKQKYERLKRENITKEDIEEIKHYFNITQAQISLLNQKFEIVNNNFITAYNTYFFVFTISVIFNLLFGVYILIDFPQCCPI